MSFLSPIPIGLVGGDLSGNLPNPTITKIQNQPIDPRVPENGYTLVYNGGEWIPTPAPTNTATIFKGTWDANSNSPDIANFSGLDDGFIWLVTVAGNTDLGGITDWKIGDYAIYSSGQWYQLSNTSFGWGLTGNAGTIPSINYIGTTDSHDLSIRANAQEIIRVLVGGGINVTGNTTISGDITLTNGHQIIIKDNGGFSTVLKAGTQSGNIIYTLPTLSGVAGANLVTDGSDNLSWKAPISILAGSGLTGGGDITTTRTISMPNVGVPSTYGSSSQVPVLTTDAQGRVSNVTNTLISINGSQITSGVVSVSNGGTGLSSSGASGNILVSNGTNFTSVPVTGDVSLTSTGVTSVNSVLGMAFSSTPTPGEGYSLIYTGGQWVPTSPAIAFANSYQTVLASEAIAAGDVCYIVNSGGSGANPTVARAQANSISTIHGVIGFATTAIAKNTTGVVQTYGQLIGPIDTHTFGQGDPLYVSATVPGGITNVKPKGPNYTFQVGIVTRQGQPQNVTTGIVFISPIMQSDTQNISDFVINAPIDHDNLMYDPVTLTWKNIQPLWVPETQTALTLASNSTITAANFLNVVYLPIKTAGGANITLNATAPIAALTKTNSDYGRQLWLHNVDNNRSITIPAGGTVKVDGGVNLVLTANTFVQFVWTGLGGNGSWIQTGKAITVL